MSSGFHPSRTGAPPASSTRPGTRASSDSSPTCTVRMVSAPWYSAFDTAPGTPPSGGYALGWGIVPYPWTGNRPVLMHNGSNAMNLATIVIDTDNDLAIVVTTNYPGKTAENAITKVTQMLYGRYGPKTAKR